MNQRSLSPIRAWFINREVPFGPGIPDHIREQWVDVPLPLRQLSGEEAPQVSINHSLDNYFDVHVIDDAMDVYAFDAVKALGLFGRQDAAGFWDCSVHSDQILTFRGSEGERIPTSVLQKILPGIELFDEVQH